MAVVNVLYNGDDLKATNGPVKGGARTPVKFIYSTNTTLAAELSFYEWGTMNPASPFEEGDTTITLTDGVDEDRKLASSSGLFYPDFFTYTIQVGGRTIEPVVIIEPRNIIPWKLIAALIIATIGAFFGIVLYSRFLS